MNFFERIPLLDSQWQRILGALFAVWTLFFSCNVRVAFAAAGDLDPSFDFNGIRILSHSGDDRGQALAIQANDGKLIVAGYTNIFGSNDIMVTRFNVDGSLDGSFNNGQPQVVDRSGDDRGQAVAVQSDGKIVVVGSTDTFGTQDILVMRFNANGSLDPSFNFGGVFILRRDGEEEHGRAVAIQSDGMPNSKIVVVGDTDMFGTKDVFVLRLNQDGSVDSSFANAGVQTFIQSPGDEQAEAVALRGDDRIVVAGTTNTLGTNDIFALQLEANGNLDSTFINGSISIVNRTSDEHGHGVALRADGGIVVVGSTDVFGTTDFFVVQLNASGELDQSFFPTITGGTLNGGVRTVEQTGEDVAQAVTIQPDGKIVVAGVSTLFGLNDFMLVRMNTDGSLDTTFDGDGIRISGPFGENRAHAVALQTDNKIVVAGDTNAFDVSDIEVMRFLGQ